MECATNSFLKRSTHLEILRRETAELLDMTQFAKEMIIEWVTSFVGLVGQLHLAALAHVAVDVKVFLHGYDTNCLFGALAMAVIIGIKLSKHAMSHSKLTSTSTGVIACPQAAHFGAKIRWKSLTQ